MNVSHSIMGSRVFLLGLMAMTEALEEPARLLFDI